MGQWANIWDSLGNYICFNYEGARVVDYIIVEETIYEKILNFRVLPQYLAQSIHQLLLLSNVVLNSKLKKENCSTYQRPINGIEKIIPSSKFS